MSKYEEWVSHVLQAIQDDWDCRDREGAICWIRDALDYGASLEDKKAAYSLLNEDWKHPVRCKYKFIANGRKIK